MSGVFLVVAVDDSAFFYAFYDGFEVVFGDGDGSLLFA